MNVVIIVVIIIKYLLNSKTGQSHILFLMRIWKNNSLQSGFFFFFKSVDLEASSICKRDLWLASFPSFSPSSWAHSVGLASEQTEKSKEKRPGNQRDDSSQSTEQKGLDMASLVTGANKESKQEGGTCQHDHLWLETSDVTSGLWCAMDPERPTMWNMLMTWGYLRLPFFFLNLLDNEFTFKNLKIKFYKPSVQWWWISKQCAAHDKLWIDVQVAEDVNG